MKTKIGIIATIVIVLLLSTVFMLSAQSAPPTPYPNLPTTPVTLTSTLHDTLFSQSPPGSIWYLDNQLSGIGSGFDVSDGTYTPSWCVDRRGLSLALDDQVYLYSSLNLPAISQLHIEDWNRINYVLNHIDPLATTADIQQAIWAFVGTYPTNPDPTPTAISQAMITDATNNGGSYVPGPGDVVAVICFPTAWETQNLQITIITLQIPRAPGLTPGFWKNNLAVYLGLANGNRGYSDPTGSPTVTKQTMAAFFDSLAGKYDLNQLYRNLSPQLDGTTATIRNDAANIFNVEAGLSPGPPWA